jgi:transposase-like protein
LTLNSKKTHCPQGHLYSEENTYTYRGARYCKKCQYETNKKRKTQRELWRINNKDKVRQHYEDYKKRMELERMIVWP